MFDIAAAHEALVRRQAVPERIFADGLVVDVPAGVYHPLPDSSSEFFIRNIKAMNPELIAKTLEIGCGCGIISLYMAANWTSRTVATDISQIAVETTMSSATAFSNALKPSLWKQAGRAPRRSSSKETFPPIRRAMRRCAS